MKRILCIFAAFCLLLTGCSKAPDNTDGTTDSTTATTTVSTTTEFVPAVPEQRPMVSVSMPVTVETTCDQDGTEIFRHIYQHMELIVPEAEIADAVILDYLSRTDTEEAAADLSARAQDAYSAEHTNWISYLVQSTYAPQRIDNGILSLFGSDVTYTGGAHAEAVYRGISYDLVTGKPLTLEDILVKDVNPLFLTELVVESLKAQKEEKNIWDGYIDSVTSRFSGSLLLDQDWFFSTAGLCFFFQPYEISPYSSGVIVAEIPYEKLTGLINDACFPSELEPAYGELSAVAFESAALSDFSQICEVTLTEEGDRVLLYTDYSVNNLVIEQGEWSADGSSFVAQSTVLRTLSLTPGDAVMITGDFEQTLPKIRITYETNDGTVQTFLSFNKSTATAELTF